jgi:predicted ATP-dependent endonuclease of OLD family
MRIESFSVENYRSITSARRIPLGSSTVLIGPNNEGKSNILRALNAAMSALIHYSNEDRHAFIPRRIRSRDYYGWKRDFPIKLQGSKKDKKTKITIDFLFNEDEISEFKSEIKSNLNGTLPVCVSFGEDGDFDIKIIKQGAGSKSLNSKGNKIAKFLSKRIQFQYIPAVRTAQQAARIVEDIVSIELRELERKEEFQSAISAIRELQRPILEKFSSSMTETLKIFMPDLKSVVFSVNDERRYTALRRSIDIAVDDGAVTELEAKGDGIQSLVALGLRRHILEESRETRAYIFAIEEPEAHLHPDAIHELRSVLNDLSIVDQVFITTHSGLLANRASVASNIIVRKATASPARNLGQIRSALGIRSHDNLINAELVLPVEGDDDKLAFRSLLSCESSELKSAFDQGRLIIDSLDGAGSLSAKISLFKGILCNVHCFIDNDSAGNIAVNRAKESNLISDGDLNRPFLTGQIETEFEDLLDPAIYLDQVFNRFGVDLKAIKPRNKRQKWSNRVRDCFAQAGKIFDDTTKQRLKFVVAECVADRPDLAIAGHAKTIVASLAREMEAKLGRDM